MVRRLGVVASTRAEFWPLKPLLDALADRPEAEVRLTMPGSRLAGAFASFGSLEETPESSPTGQVAGEGERETPSLVRRGAACATDVSAAIVGWRPDILIVLGDRYELLGVALAATIHGVPLAHIHGGERTIGAIDDVVRHAVTKLAHLHFCALEEYAARVRSMGEEPWRVQVSGAPGIDRLLGLARLHTLDEVERRIGRRIARPLGILTYHPPTARPEALAAELEAVLGAAEGLGTVLVTAPGPDPGSEEVRRRLVAWQADHPETVVFVTSLEALYPVAVASADVVLGNSSSGIIEAPSLGVPVVNVGIRQEGRVAGVGVIHCGADPEEVRVAVKRALTPEFRAIAAAADNPYGDGHASERIAEALIGARLDRLVPKQFQDRT